MLFFFLGNKAFVIDFLETGQFCCVYWYDRLGYKSLGKYISPTRISTGLYSNLSGVLLLSVNNILLPVVKPFVDYLTRKMLLVLSVSLVPAHALLHHD